MEGANSPGGNVKSLATNYKENRYNLVKWFYKSHTDLVLEYRF